MKKVEPIRILDLPGVRDLEGSILLHRDDPGRIVHEVALVSQKLFGITQEDTRFEVPDEYWDLPEFSPERVQIEEQYEAHEDQFETGNHLTDDETMELLAKVGLDFSDERGLPLRCTKQMARPAEAAAKGIKGKLPDRAEVEVMQWTDTLTRERDAYLANKRKS
jgi:hypothetical protein